MVPRLLQPMAEAHFPAYIEAFRQTGLVVLEHSAKLSIILTKFLFCESVAQRVACRFRDIQFRCHTNLFGPSSIPLHPELLLILALPSHSPFTSHTPPPFAAFASRLTRTKSKQKWRPRWQPHSRHRSLRPLRRSHQPNPRMKPSRPR